MGLVFVFESSLRLIQPRGRDTMVITSPKIDGKAINRAVSRAEQGNDVFVAVNHWPRACARRVSENPNVQITDNETRLSYNAGILEGKEHDKAVSDFPVTLALRILTGFPPRYFIRLALQEDAV